MESGASPPSPPVGWAQSHDVPPGHVTEKPRPGMQLLIAYLILFAIGSVLSIFGHSMTYQAGTATAGLTPAAASHSGQVISGIGFLFIVAGLVVAVLAVVRMVKSRKDTDRSPTRPCTSGIAD